MGKRNSGGGPNPSCESDLFIFRLVEASVFLEPCSLFLAQEVHFTDPGPSGYGISHWLGGESS